MSAARGDCGLFRHCTAPIEDLAGVSAALPTALNGACGLLNCGIPGESRPVELERALTEYRRLLEQRFGERLRSLVLFGSRARGDAGPDSDADVSVVVRDLSEAERGDAIELAFDAWRRTGRVAPLISPLVWSEAEREDRRRAERRIALDIDREGIPL